MRVIAKSLRFVPTRAGQYWCAQGLLDADKVELLGRCQSLRGIDEHAANICDKLGLGPEEQLATATSLNELRAAGFLWADQDLIDPTRAMQRETATPISSCAILTRDRPDALARVLEDFGQPALAQGCRILVADDGDSPARLPQGMELAVLGRAQRQAWIDTICDTELHGIATAALLPLVAGNSSSVGANMNAVMLACVDQKMARFDDDTGGPISRAHTWEPSRRRVMPPLEPSELLIHDDLEQAIRDGVVCDKTPVEILEDGLGEPLGVQVAAGTVELPDSVPPATVNALARGGRVLSSMLGVAGDSGMASSHWYLSLLGEAGDRLDERFEQRLYSRFVQRAAPSTQFSQSSFFMSASIGLDLRECLPPFYPTHRNSDSLFALCLRHIAPDAFRAYHPYMVSHRPASPRRLPPESLFQGINSQNRNTILSEAVQCCAPAAFAANLEQACEQLGQQLQHLAGQPRTSFVHWLRECALQRHQDRLNWYQHLLTVVSPVRHTTLAQGQERTQAAIAMLGNEQALVPPGFTLTQTQTQLREFGRLLEAWPSLRAHARAVPVLADQHAE